MEFANWMGSLLESLFGFLYNIEYGYMALLSVLFASGVVVIYFRFFKHEITDINWKE